MSILHQDNKTISIVSSIVAPYTYPAPRNGAKYEEMMATPKRILMIVTSHALLGSTGTKTGFWLEELAAPYLEFANSGAEIDIASPAGGKPPADPKSSSDPGPVVRAFLDDPVASGKLAATRRLGEVQQDYDAYFVVGGHGVMWDLSDDHTLGRLLTGAYEAGRVVAAVCHGPAALVNVKLSNGAYLVAGKRVASFTDAEEAAIGLEKIVPFALESTLKQRGAVHQAGPLWKPLAVRDGKLITGQNPASSVAVAKATLEALA
jgi:putative intracellular protease/amidase